MAGFASIFGLLLQIVLIVIVARLIFAWWQRRNMTLVPSYAAARPATGHSLSGLGGMLNGTGRPPAAEPVKIGKPNYDAFERLLGEIQSAYSREDLSALRARVTPEMLSYFSEQLADNASRGLINRVTDVKLLQGDLAEAWREGPQRRAPMGWAGERNRGLAAQRAQCNIAVQNRVVGDFDPCVRVASIGPSRPTASRLQKTVQTPLTRRAC
jgi:hypothetical protein